MYLKTKILQLTVGFCILSYLVLAGFLISSIWKPDAPNTDLNVFSVTTEEDADGDCRLILQGQGFSDRTQAYLSLDMGNRFTIAGDMPSWGFAKGIAAGNGLAFVADTMRGLLVVDIKNPTQPAIIGSLSIPGRVWNLAVDNDRVLLAAEEAGLLVVSVRDPANPRIVQTLDTPGTVRDLWVEGDTAFVADGPEGVHRVALGQGEPRIVDSLDTRGEASSIWKEGSYLYVAGDQGGLQIIRCDGQAGLRLVRTIALPDRARNVTVYRNRAYVSAGKSGIQVVAVDVPDKATLAAAATIQGSAYAARWIDGRLWVIAGDGGLQVFAPQADGGLRMLGVIDTPGVAWDVAAVGRHVIVADGKFGLQIIDQEKTAQLVAPKALYAPGTFLGLAASDQRTCVVATATGLQVFANDSDRLRKVGEVRTPARAVDVAIGDGRAYVVDTRGNLHAVLLEDVAAGIAETLPLEGRPKRVIFHRHKLFVAGLRGHLHVVEALPGHPLKLVASTQLPRPLLDLAASGGYLYAARGVAGTYIVDIRHASRPSVIGKVAGAEDLRSVACSTALQVHEGRLYIANGRAGIQAFDLLQADAPRLVGSLCTLGNVVALTASKGRLFMGDLRNGILMADSRGPQGLRMVGALGLDIKAKGMMVDGEELFVSSNFGVLTFPLPLQVTDLKVRGSERLALSIPRLPRQGRYALLLSDGKRNLILPQVIDSGKVIARGDAD